MLLPTTLSIAGSIPTSSHIFVLSFCVFLGVRKIANVRDEIFNKKKTWKRVQKGQDERPECIFTFIIFVKIA